MTRRKPFKVYLSNEQAKLLEKIAQSLGMKPEEILKIAFLGYAESIGALKAYIHNKPIRLWMGGNTLQNRAESWAGRGCKQRTL